MCAPSTLLDSLSLPSLCSCSLKELLGGTDLGKWPTLLSSAQLSSSPGPLPALEVSFCSLRGSGAVPEPRPPREGLLRTQANKPHSRRSISRPLRLADLTQQPPAKPLLGKKGHLDLRFVLVIVFLLWAGKRTPGPWAPQIPPPTGMV